MFNYFKIFILIILSLVMNEDRPEVFKHFHSTSLSCIHNILKALKLVKIKKQ
jgi:hypothetical protein